MLSPSIFFDTLFCLIEKKKVTREEIAQRLGVSTRTVSRYVDSLCDCGIPILSDIGKNGGYYIPDDYKLERTLLTSEERARVIGCLKAAAIGYSDGLCEKLVNKFSALGQSAGNAYMINTETLILDAGSWNSPVASRNKIQALMRAAESRTSVRFEYTDRHEYRTEREFDPYCVVLKEGLWYVYGYCHTRADFRLFKLARIRTLLSTESTYPYRPSDVYAKLNGELSDAELVDFTIEFSNMILPDIEEWLGLDAISETGMHYTAHARMYGGNALVAKLLSFGSSVKVLSPPALREELLVECKRTLNVYNEV